MSAPLSDGSDSRIEDPNEADRCPECHFPGRPAECAAGCTKGYPRIADEWEADDAR